ncbi:MFS transporter [Christiangramia salexigens]
MVFSQFCCTSMWFAGNAVMTDLVRNYELSSSALGHLTSAVQFGFIAGTLLFAILNIADRNSPSKVFFYCALTGAILNLGILIPSANILSLLSLRFLTGFSLAGIYPIGMKIAADHFKDGLGRSLGFLVGALVLGTAFPHLLKSITTSVELDWRLVIVFTSILSILGGTLIFTSIPDGPYRRLRKTTDLLTAIKVFRHKDFRAAAFGYFGHMWELYAFWAFVPVILFAYNSNPGSEIDIPITSFWIIAGGGLACVLSGLLSSRTGTKRTAATALFLSGLCCLISPFIFNMNSEFILILFLMLWGMVVVADSPLISTLVARNADLESRGTALTIVNSIGFAITIISIQLLNALSSVISPAYLLLFLAPGPIVGLIALYRK